MIDIERERERGRDTGRGRSSLHASGARRGTRSRDSRIAPWAKGRHETAAPPRDLPDFQFFTGHQTCTLASHLTTEAPPPSQLPAPRLTSAQSWMLPVSLVCVKGSGRVVWPDVQEPLECVI